MVWEFIKDLRDVKDLFEEFELDPGCFWLYLERSDQDIPIEFDWPMKRVMHLQVYLNASEKKE
jgi:hypothetical protein